MPGYIKIYLYFMVFLLPSYANAASFDCAKAWHRVEKLICADEELSKQDSEFGDYYRSIKKTSLLVQQQRFWIISRNQCIDAKNVKQCIKISYQTRLAQLKALYGDASIESVAPTKPDEKISLPVSVAVHYSLNTGSWYPLPEKDMKAAAVDTAQAKLSETGSFSFLGTKGNKKSSSRMNFNISLIGPAQVAKLTIQLFLPNRPSFISTSSISVRGLDHQGIYKAFEHIGDRAAKQMLVKFNAYVLKTVELKLVEQVKNNEDGKVGELYNLAQSLKANRKYDDSRVAFEKVAEIKNSQWRELAVDELRYGLLMFEVKQSFNELSRRDTGIKDKKIVVLKSINLLRQIIAENQDDVDRIREAQGMLDNFNVSNQSIAVVMDNRKASGHKQVERVLHSLIQRKMSIYAMGGARENFELCDDRDMRGVERLNFSIVEKREKSSYVIQDNISSAKYSVVCKDENVIIERL